MKEVSRIYHDPQDEDVAGLLAIAADEPRLLKCIEELRRDNEILTFQVELSEKSYKSVQRRNADRDKAVQVLLDTVKNYDMDELAFKVGRSLPDVLIALRKFYGEESDD